MVGGYQYKKKQFFSQIERKIGGQVDREPTQSQGTLPRGRSTKTLGSSRLPPTQPDERRTRGLQPQPPPCWLRTTEAVGGTRSHRPLPGPPCRPLELRPVTGEEHPATLAPAAGGGGHWLELDGTRRWAGGRAGGRRFLGSRVPPLHLTFSLSSLRNRKPKHRGAFALRGGLASWESSLARLWQVGSAVAGPLCQCSRAPQAFPLPLPLTPGQAHYQRGNEFIHGCETGFA